MFSMTAPRCRFAFALVHAASLASACFEGVPENITALAQEQRLGKLGRETRKLLDRLAKGGAELREFRAKSGCAAMPNCGVQLNNSLAATSRAQA